MEPNDLDIVAAGAAIGGLGGLLVGGLGGALVGAAGGALAGAKFKQLKEEQSPQQRTRTEERIQSNSNSPGSSISPVQPPPIPTPPVKIITKQFLVLVVSHLQADFLESLKAKGRINVNEGETLYEITKYLWLGDESEFSQREANLNRYLVSEGEESEYDIYLVYIELKQADERFKPKVNQLDRFDAFRNLAALVVTLEVSPRLQMEAYESIGVYNR